MRAIVTLAFLLFAVAFTLAPAPGHAAMQVVFGDSWDPPGTTLQEIVDARYGPGKIDVRRDYIGRQPTDLDPFFWIDARFTAFVVEEVAGLASSNVLGWYAETGGIPVIDGISDGVVFRGADGSGDVTMVNFDGPVFRWGFYLDPAGPGASINAPQGEYFFTNRFANDRGASGGGAMHTPFDGDVQALVYDVSAWTHPNTWLVAFDDLDTGVSPGPCCSTTDNDFNDLVFEVTAYTVTEARALTFGALKRRYR
jgi:hypothetical protein